MKARAIAHPNIALVKYWGKRSDALNLPAVGSISITLDTLATDTRVHFDPGLEGDEFVLNGVSHAEQGRRVSRFLDLFRARAGVECRARIRSSNNFPTGAGLASSAAGFAALARAVDAALNLNMDRETLSIMARRGSGSAGRSLFGGFAEQRRGQFDDRDDDAGCHSLRAAEDWPLEVVVAITETAQKKTGSTQGMSRSADSSPYFGAWINAQPDDLELARTAIATQDFDRLAEVAEFSCLKMHGLAMGSRPPLLYWNVATVDCIHAVRAMRDDGWKVFFTVDAGPQVKVICAPGWCSRVAERLAGIAGVTDTRCCGLGRGAYVVV